MSKAYYSGTADSETIARSSTLTKRDLGKHIVVCDGCLYLRDTEAEAQELVKAIND